VGQRVYRGWCANNGQVESSIARFQESRETLYAEVANLEELEPSVRERVAEYMDDYYDIIADPQAVAREIISHCRE
jgi:hypothetical protein